MEANFNQSDGWHARDPIGRGATKSPRPWLWLSG
jgi:hypothetical protein